MSFADERRAIEQRFEDNFTALAASRIKYENQRFTQPTEGAWVALTILTGDGIQASINTSPLNRYPGVIQIDIRVPEDTGTATARTHADTIEAIFRNQQFSAAASGIIKTRTPSITTRGVIDGWYTLTVSVPYIRDKIF
jgi:hypothetical protein